MRVPICHRRPHILTLSFFSPTRAFLTTRLPAYLSAGETLNINADVAARELAIALRPMRVVFISAGGGWKEDGKVVPSVNMAVDYPVWVRRDYTGRQVRHVPYPDRNSFGDLS